MKINDILKEENAGKVYIITNGEWKGEKITITEFPAAQITLNGRTDDIEDVIHLAGISEMEFEEEEPYKEISGREALKLMLDGGVVYGDNEFNFVYYISGTKMFYEGIGKIRLESTLELPVILTENWYIKK